MSSFVLVVALAALGPQSVPGPAQGAFFALSVADVEAASRWYSEKLDFRVLSSGEAPNKIARFAILEGDGTLIELIQHRDAAPRPAAADAFKTHGIFKIGFVVADLDGVYRQLKARSVAVAYDLMPAKDVPLRSFSVRDVEGNLVQFFGR